MNDVRRLIFLSIWNVTNNYHSIPSDKSLSTRYIFVIFHPRYLRQHIMYISFDLLFVSGDSWVYLKRPHSKYRRGIFYILHDEHPFITTFFFCLSFITHDWLNIFIDHFCTIYVSALHSVPSISSFPSKAISASAYHSCCYLKEPKESARIYKSRRIRLIY